MLTNPQTGLHALNRWVDTASSEAIGAAAHALEDWPDSAEVAVRLRRALLSRASAAADTSAIDEHLLNLSYALARRGHLRESYWLYQGRPGPFFTQIALFGVVPAGHVAARAKLRPEGPIAWFAQQRDTVALKSAVRRLDSIARLDRDSRTPSWDVARGRAYLALARRDTAEAINRFIPVIDSLCPGCSFSRTYVDIYSAAPLLMSRGLDREAATWLDYNNTTVLRPVFDVWFALARGRVSERLHEREKAAAAYRFVVASWQHADPGLEIHVAEARAALKRLGTSAMH